MNLRTHLTGAGIVYVLRNLQRKQCGVRIGQGLLSSGCEPSNQRRHVQRGAGHLSLRPLVIARQKDAQHLESSVVNPHHRKSDREPVVAVQFTHPGNFHHSKEVAIHV